MNADDFRACFVKAKDILDANPSMVRFQIDILIIKMMLKCTQRNRYFSKQIK